MRQIKEICRLYLVQDLGIRPIARACNISPSTAQGYVNKLDELKLDFATIDAMGEEELKKLFRGKKPDMSRKPMPDLQYLAREMKRKGVTLQILHEEYLRQYPDGYSRSHFYQIYRSWAKSNKPTMRLNHKAGKNLFIDFSGAKAAYRDPETGETLEAELYVAVLGASSYTFACAVASQKVEDFVGSTIKAFEFMGGCPECIVLDNLKSGVTHPCYYDPELNPTFAEMAGHYNVAVLPTRVRKPKDKAKVESGVQNVQRRILAALRDREFFSLYELNEAIAEELKMLNRRPMQVTGRSRYELFVELEKNELKPLPKERFSLSQWKKARVHIDYHVEVKKSFYSVPYRLIGKQVEIKYNERVVEIYHDCKRIAYHIRSHRAGQYVTDNAHMPHEHRYYLEWSPSRIKKWGATIGPHTRDLMEKIMQSKQHPEHGFRGCLGIIRLSRQYSPQRVEAASQRVLQFGAYSFKSVKSILAKGLDKVVPIEQAKNQKPIHHDNLRGESYYDADDHR